jgi:tryptophan synthase alpha chain
MTSLAMTSVRTTSVPTTRISKLFERLKTVEQRPALIGYLTAGDPSPARTAGLVAALVRGGVDLIELGVPFSDPIADGPVIQRAADRALCAGMTLHGVLDIAREVRQDSDVPLLLFTYMNPVMRYGLTTLARDAAGAGIDGCLLTDMSVEEAEPYIGAMRENNLDTVFLAAPTSTSRRLELVARYSSGFVYLVSRTGVTGEQQSLSESALPLIERTRKVTDLPLAMGFGIATRQHVSEVGALADGVVVGSAIVRTIEKSGSGPELERTLETFTRDLAAGLKRSNP